MRTSLAVPHANGDRPVIIMKRITPRLHTSERERGEGGGREGERGGREGGREGGRNSVLSSTHSTQYMYLCIYMSLT